MSYKALYQKSIPPRDECKHEMFWLAYGYGAQFNVCKLCGYGHIAGHPELEIETELSTLTGTDGTVWRHWMPKR